MRVSIALALLAVTAAGCGHPPLELPTGPSSPLADPQPILSSALAHCQDLHALTAELGLSGRVGSEKLRGRLLAGFERPDGIRLEGLAPFGAPVFVLAGRGGVSTLLLPRDDRVVRAAPPATVVEALAGVAISPARLMDWLAGCLEKTDATNGRRYGADWVAIGSADESGTAWFRRAANAWRLTAVQRDGLTTEFVSDELPQPTRLRLRRPAVGAAPAVDISLSITDVERNVDLSAAAFEVDVPATAVEITIDDLRRSGPLRDVPTGAVAPGTEARP
jgi:hypothetical protein